jgi:hypothetical protein
MKTIAVLFITIVIATGGFYGYQLFHQELLKEENAMKDAEIKSSTAQREAEESAKQAASAILEKEKFATELAKQQAVLEAKNLNNDSTRIISEARSTQEEDSQKNTQSVKMAIDGYFSNLNEGNIEKSIDYWNYPSDKIKKIIRTAIKGGAKYSVTNINIKLVNNHNAEVWINLQTHIDYKDDNWKGHFYLIMNNGNWKINSMDMEKN